MTGPPVSAFLSYPDDNKLVGGEQGTGFVRELDSYSYSDEPEDIVSKLKINPIRSSAKTAAQYKRVVVSGKAEGSENGILFLSAELDFGVKKESLPKLLTTEKRNQQVTLPLSIKMRGEFLSVECTYTTKGTSAFSLSNMTIFFFPVNRVGAIEEPCMDTSVTLLDSSGNAWTLQVSEAGVFSLFASTNGSTEPLYLKHQSGDGGICQLKASLTGVLSGAAAIGTVPKTCRVVVSSPKGRFFELTVDNFCNINSVPIPSFVSNAILHQDLVA